MVADPIVTEAQSLVDDLRGEGVHVRLMGGVAVALRSPSTQQPPLQRTHHDIDMVTSRKGGRQLHKAIEALGYRGDEQFNTMQGSRRLIFYGANEGGHKVDVFIEKVEMCHTIDVSDRLDADPHTLSLADLLLLKLQIVELNEKDAVDVAALVLDHEVTGDESGINGDYIARLCADDWGLWKTITGTIERLRSDSDNWFDPEYRSILNQRLDQLNGAIEAAPRTRRWKMRARVGERKRWYQLPEEVDR